MSASANIVSFLLIESCRLEPFPKGTILLATEVLKISIVTIFADPNDMWREWKIKFLNVVDTHAPLRTKRVCSKRSEKDYFRVEKTYAWTRNHEVESRWVNTFKLKNPQDWDEVQRVRNKVNSKVKIAKESYYKQSVTEHKNDSRRTWQTINWNLHLAKVTPPPLTN